MAARLAGLPAFAIPQQHLCKGNYFSLSGASPMQRLVYPIPEASGSGLGIHLTIDMAGRTKFGPDVEWLPPGTQKLDYTVDPARSAAFYSAIRAYYPALQEGALQPSYAGIRPKVTGQRQPAGDFLIQDQRMHGIHGLVNLFGIESPGLTSSLAVAEHVRSLLVH